MGGGFTCFLPPPPPTPLVSCVSDVNDIVKKGGGLGSGGSDAGSWSVGGGESKERSRGVRYWGIGNCVQHGNPPTSDVSGHEEPRRRSGLNHKVRDGGTFGSTLNLNAHLHISESC